MVQLRFENLIPPSKGEQPKLAVEFTNKAGLSPAEQWFYHWVREQNLATPYPGVEQVLAVLQTHLPQRTKRYSPNIPDPTSGESWLRTVLMTGELISLQPDPHHAPLTIAVHPSTGKWKQGFEKISSHEFSAARRSLGIDRHILLVLGGIVEAAPSSDALMDALKQQALVPSECATIYLKS